jgi:two-component system response regulator AtoC
MSLYADSVAHLERILLEQVLHHSAGNQSQAAEILGITRGTLRNKIREHGIRITQSISVENEQDEAESPSCASQS